MRRLAIMCAVIATVIGATSAAAQAQRPATRHERTTVLAAAVHHGKVSTAHAKCVSGIVSTVDPRWAVVEPGGSSFFSCGSDDVLEHLKGRVWTLPNVRWRWVTTSGTADGVSQVRCPVSGAPVAVP